MRRHLHCTAALGTASTPCAAKAKWSSPFRRPEKGREHRQRPKRPNGTSATSDAQTPKSSSTPGLQGVGPGGSGALGVAIMARPDRKPKITLAQRSAPSRPRGPRPRREHCRGAGMPGRASGCADRHARCTPPPHREAHSQFGAVRGPCSLGRPPRTRRAGGLPCVPQASTSRWGGAAVRGGTRDRDAGWADSLVLRHAATHSRAPPRSDAFQLPGRPGPG